MAGLDVEVVIDKAGFTGPMGMATEMTVKSGEVTYAVSIDYDNSTVKVDDGASIEIYDENSEETAAIMMVVYMMQMIGEEYLELTPDSILEILIG